MTPRRRIRLRRPGPAWASLPRDLSDADRHTDERATWPTLRAEWRVIATSGGRQHLAAIGQALYLPGEL